MSVPWPPVRVTSVNTVSPVRSTTDMSRTVISSGSGIAGAVNTAGSRAGASSGSTERPLPKGGGRSAMSAAGFSGAWSEAGVAGSRHVTRSWPLMTMRRWSLMLSAWTMKLMWEKACRCSV
jgi:hypothetical protein